MITGTSLADRWFRRFTDGSGAHRTVFLFPHGGGAASFYRPLARLLPHDVEPVVVQYPGREDRMGEACFDTMPALADAVADALSAFVRRPFTLFGHSMGASVAFEVADRLRYRCGLVPEVLVASGRPGPLRQRPGEKHLDDDTLWDEVHRLGGTVSHLAGNGELRDLMMPRLRADYRLIERYRPDPGLRLSCPIEAWYGDDDPEVDAADVLAWRDATSSRFDYFSFPGNHFYLRDRSDQVAARLAAVARGKVGT